ncbi:predicted protein [Histoplasma capsulatum var. duboisii H88]|uniref:Predicted protein n=1 Tax=Ajellomyces capsulatus (strain H88) TaxID=544711 RepID=F0UT55_AJEC8|nr:predicted protein [Histoplasma capsulatum var. duboisii H88]
MTPIFVTRDIFDREGMTGRLSGMALDINTTSWQKRSNMDESGRENNPMLSAIAPVGKVDFDLLSLGVILKKGRGKNQFMNGGSLRTGLEKTKFDDETSSSSSTAVPRTLLSDSSLAGGARASCDLITDQAQR